MESCDQEDDIDAMDHVDFGNPFDDSSLEDDSSGNEDDCASDGQSEASEKSVYEVLLSCLQEDELHRDIFSSEAQDAEQLEPMVSEPASSSNQAPAHGPIPSPPEPPVAPEPPFPEGVVPRVVERSERKPATFVSKSKKDKDLSMDIDGKGDLRYNKAASNFTAYCKIPGHGHDCRRSRTSTSPKGRAAGNNPFQGRPVGLLAAWIQSGDQYETASAHKQGLNNITYELRVAARAHVETLPGSADLLSQERTRFPGEILEPPVIL